MSAQQEVIKNFMKSLDTTTKSGVAALDEAVKSATNSKFTTIQSLIDKMVSDCENSSSADSFLKDYCGIILDNYDTGAITGSDAGGSKTKTAESIVPESGSLKNFTGNSFSTGGLNFQLSYVDTKPSSYDGHVSDRSFSSLSSKEKYIWQGLYTWWGKESLNLITKSYGNNFGFGSSSSATVKDIYVGFYNSADNILAYVLNWSESDGIAVDLDLMVNMYYYDNIDTSDPNGSSSTIGASYLDRTLAHELTHASMGTNITDFNGLPCLIKEGMAELTHGIDDTRGYDIRTLAGDATLLEQALGLSTKYKKVDGVYSPDYAGGYMLLRYLANQEIPPQPFTQGDDYYENTASNVTLKALGGNDSVESSGANNVKIYGNADNDTLRAYGTGNKITLSGDSGNDYLQLYSAIKNSKMYGGAGKDTIYSAATNATTSGGSGNDFIHIYANGNKNLVNGGIGNDTIEGAGKNATINGGAGNDYLHLYTSATNTTINGGTGNDTIKSYASSSTTYIYKNGDSKDVIDGFNFGTDKIRVTNGYVKSKKTSGNDVILTIGKGSIRIKDGKGKKITVVNSFGKTANYTVGTSTKNLSSDVAQLWFDEDNSSSNVYEQSLDKIAGVNGSISPLIDETSNSLTSTHTGPITSTKYVFYANQNKIS